MNFILKSTILELYLYSIFLITAISIFFIPSFFSLSSINLRIDDIIILSVIPITLLVLYKNIEINTYVIVLLIVFISMVISTLYGYIFLDVPFNVRDINELVRMLKPLLLFSFLLLIERQVFIELLFRTLIIFMLIFIFIGLSESIKSFYFHDYIIQFYSTDNRIGTSRILTTTTNPNDGAVLTLFFLFFSISMFIVYKKYYYLISSFALVFILLNTGSRTAFFIAILFFIIFFIFTKSFSLKHKLIILFLVIIGVTTLYSYLENYIERILTLINAFNLEDTSLNIRFGLWGEALEIFNQSKILGWGVAKEIHPNIVDGEYFILLRRYGLVGLSIVFFMMLYPLYIIKNKFQTQNLNKKEKVLYFTFFTYVLAGLFVMFTNNFITSYILFFPFIILSVLVFKKDEIN